ncbi:MAG TPA: ABC transporter ATP-binding protein [Actinomycetota bacterium]|nr:ABC transporter ATP-binding protein [Actinomycetota bacterium]
MLDVRDIDVYYGPVQALRGLSLRVDEGEMVALLGANGAGKTTTLRAISGLLSPAHGSIRVGGQDAGRLPAQKVVRLGVAHVPEGRELFAELTVVENLRLGHWSRRRERARLVERVERVFELFPRLRERADQLAGTMSGGEQQMLVAGRALMSEPRLLLVDELSMGLAPIVVEQLFGALRQVNREGTAVLLVEQFVHLALQNTRRAYVLAKGEVAVEGRSEELLASPDVMAAYLGETGGSDAASRARSNGSNGAHPAGVTTSAPLTHPSEGSARTAGEPQTQQLDTEGDSR